MLSHFLDLLPVFLAIIALIMLSRRYDYARRQKDRAILFLSAIATTVVIVVQLSLWATNHFETILINPPFINIMWDTFVSLVMLIFIIISHPRHDQNNS